MTVMNVNDKIDRVRRVRDGRGMFGALAAA